MARALYIHWPFCARKCPYCDFNSHVRSDVDTEGWHAALLADLRAEYAAIPDKAPLASVFFGGGTPSLMPPSLVAALLEEANRLFGFTDDIEITLEANPSSSEAARFRLLRCAGVNRVSLGVQALDDEALTFLGRLHSAHEALGAVSAAQEAFDRVSIDLIYARPRQTVASWRSELDRALALGTGHMSLYQLAIEPGTRFASDFRRGVLTPLDEDSYADLFALTRERMALAGMPAYEISNFSTPGRASVHNLTYWRYEDYAGIGPGAHGRRAGHAVERHRKPENYLAAIARQGHGVSVARPLSPHEQADEALMMGLRLSEGIDLARLSQRTGFAVSELIDEGRLAPLEAAGLLAWEGDRLRLAEAGFAVLDAVLGQIIPDRRVPA
jgi:oxygen-independent coproporphyrinogen-3 oxidase